MVLCAKWPDSQMTLPVASFLGKTMCKDNYFSNFNIIKRQLIYPQRIESPTVHSKVQKLNILK